MSANDLFKAGRLQEAIEAQLQEVKNKPADHGRRLFLFELLAFAGDLDRARKQVEVINYNEMERDAAVQSYRKLLDAEQSRRRVFREGIMPQFLVPPPEYLRKRLEVINCLRGNQPAQAAEFLAQVAEVEPAVHGQLNEKPFGALRDCDDLFGPVLEVMAHGDYYWLPLQQVDTLAMNPPKYPRDLLWVPAKLSIRDGPAGDVFLPTLYPGSYEHADIQIKLGRQTDWKEAATGLVRGLGLHMFLVDEDAVSLLEWRELQVE
jgi:type VI secretion system protein ImpE